jgi:superfamily II DNA or RNA helicase
LSRSVTLRPWQHAALAAFHASTSPDFLAMATPGAGKTTFALTAARQALAADASRRLVVVVPTAHLKMQWARAGRALDLHLDPQWTATDGALPADMHGIVTTYQQVATSASVLQRLSGGSFTVFDELHHAADDRAWGDAIRVAFAGAEKRLALSGTPFRSDTQSIPFVHYSGNEAVADFEYGYGDALRDRGVVRPVYFPRLDGQMEWSAPDGSIHSHTFDDDLDRTRAGHRLRTALSAEGEWLPAVLQQAHAQLRTIRKTHPDAAGLVIATDQAHAADIARILREQLRVRAIVATSDDPTASERIAAFTTSKDPWIVAVRMVSEGVDVPRLRVGVFATTTTTELFFRQAVGRLVRHTRGLRGQKAFLFIPDEPRLRARAFAIAEQRRHSLRPPLDGDGTVGRVPGDAGDDQPSLFAPISAVRIGDVDGPDWLLDDDELDEAPSPVELTIDLPPLPRRRDAAGSRDASDGIDPRTLREQKTALRDANTDRARHISRHTGLSHGKVNAELNRVSGVKSVREATLEQLQRRLAKADAWLVQARARRVAG